MKKNKLSVCIAMICLCIFCNGKTASAKVCSGSAIVTTSQSAISIDTAINSDNKIFRYFFDVQYLTHVNHVLTDIDGDISVSKTSKMYTTSDVCVRSAASKKSDVIEILPLGKSVRIIDYDRKNKWQKISYQNQILYISRKYLSKKKPKIVDVKSVKLIGLSNSQKQRAYTIASVCIKEWKHYGVLPSIAIAQAMQESTLGKYCRGNNLWGIKSGAVSYSSLEAGVYAYMKVINNGYYKGAPFQKQYSVQIRRILNGGYCVPVGDYYNNIINIVNKYKLYKFDKMIE